VTIDVACFPRDSAVVVAVERCRGGLELTTSLDRRGTTAVRTERIGGVNAAARAVLEELARARDGVAFVQLLAIAPVAKG